MSSSKPTWLNGTYTVFIAQSEKPKASIWKPTWLNRIIKVLLDNVGQLHVFIVHLGIPEFNATVIWSQLNEHDNEMRFYKFMDKWYEKTKHPTLTQIVQALKDMRRNAIINFIEEDYILKEQLTKEENEGNDNQGNYEARPIPVPNYTIGEAQPPNTQEEPKASGSKPTWFNIGRKILSNHLDDLYVFIAHLETQEFNATVKWSQLDDRNNETRFYQFMDKWYESSKHPTLTQIVQALKDMHRNAIINLIEKDDILKEQLKKEENEKYVAACTNKRKTPIQETGDGHFSRDSQHP